MSEELRSDSGQRFRLVYAVGIRQEVIADGLDIVWAYEYRGRLAKMKSKDQRAEILVERVQSSDTPAECRQ